MNNLGVKLFIALLCAGLIFGAGWRVKGAFIAERDLAIAEAKEEFITVYKDAEKGKADLLEKKLGELKANEKTIIREREKIVDRPVYRNECIDADGVRLIESARNGEANTVKSTGEVPATD
jgi:hypothetical protein